jgi:hypothetical protein
MGYLFGRFVLIFAMSAFLATPPSAVAGNPIGDFFKRLGNSIAHPRSTPPPRKTAPKRTSAKKPGEKEQAASPETSPGAPPAPPVPTPTPTPPPRTPMPVPPVVRSAAGVPPAKRSRRDMPYGIPVPNKPGFVTSPYAPKSGYVDVRGFPSGTEVNDPYTGKTFLTP